MENRSDWASNPCLPGPRMQNLKVGACMGVLSQIFDWNGVLGGNKNLATTRFVGSDVQMSARPKEEAEIDRWAMVKPVLRSGQTGFTASREGYRDWESSAEDATSQLGNLRVMVVSDNSTQELRQILHTKQEPFVLQDVIREKRQPVRIKSSLEVKVGSNQTGQATRRSQNSNKAKASDSRKVRADNGGGKLTATKSVAYKSITGSADAIVQRSNRAPAESMVAMPSNQAVCGQSVTKALWSPIKNTNCKVASPGRNYCKSPNKRALLMEAAAKILEGSNRSRKSRISLRSLLAELDRKHAQDTPREKLLKAKSSQKEPSGKQEMPSQNMVRGVEDKKHFSKPKAHPTSRGKAQINGSSENHPGTSQWLVKDFLTMPSRVFPYDRPLNASEPLATLATPTQYSPVVQEFCAQRPGGCILHWPAGMGRREEGTADSVNQAVKGRLGSSLRLFPQRRAMQQEWAVAVLPNVIMEDPPQLEHKASINDGEDHGPTSRSPSWLISNDGFLEHGLVFNCYDEIPENTSFGGSLAAYPHDSDGPMVKFATRSHISCGTDTARSKSRCEDSKEELRLHTGKSSESLTGPADVVIQACCMALDARYMKMEQPSTNRDELCMSAKVDCKEFLNAGKKPSILRLCDYGWWERENYQIITPAEEENDQQLYPDHPDVSHQFSEDCDGYASPTTGWWERENYQIITPAEEENDQQLYQDHPDVSHQFSEDCDGYASPTTVRSPYVVNVFEDSSNLEGELSISPDCTCMGEFQQSSPVSVLDAVFEEDSPMLGNSFACFEEARQQLLEKVRRYEILAEMDLDMLVKLTDEQSCSEVEEESDGHNHEELRKTDAAYLPVSSCQEQTSSSFVEFPELHSLWSEGDFSTSEVQGWECDNVSHVCVFEESQYDICVDSDAERYSSHLQELEDKDFRPAKDCTFDLIEQLKKGERLSCKLFFDCLGEAVEPHALGIPNHVIESHPWTNTLQELGKPAFSSALGVVGALIQTDLGYATRNWRDFSKDIEEMGIELESILFGILIHELLSDLLQES